MTDKNTGFIKIDRKILEWRWATHPNTAWMFITLLLMANYKDADFENITVHRGQVATSIRKLAIKTGQSYAQARRTLSNMVSSGELTITRHSRYIVITIVKYDEYQGTDNHLQNRRQSFAKQMTIISQQSKKNNINIIQERKKEKNIRRVAVAPVPPSGESPPQIPERDPEHEYPFKSGWHKKPAWMSADVWERDKDMTVDDIPTAYRGRYDDVRDYLHDRETGCLE